MAEDRIFHASFTLTEKDVVGGNLLHMLAAYKRPKTYLFFPIAFLVLMALVTILDRPSCWCQIVAAMKAGVIGVVGMFAARTLLGFALLPMRARRIYRQIKTIQREQTITLTREAVCFESKDMLYRCARGDMAKWNESSRFFLLYASDRSFHLVPIRPIDEEMLAAMRDHLLAAGVNKDR